MLDDRPAPFVAMINLCIYYEAYTTKASAMERERKLKLHGKGLAEIKKRASFC